MQINSVGIYEFMNLSVHTRESYMCIFIFIVVLCILQFIYLRTPTHAHTHTHTHTLYIYYLRRPKFKLKHLKRSYMFRTYDHPQGAYIVPC